MKITATFGPALIACAAPSQTSLPRPPHPILSDVPAIEAALATLFRLSKREAIQRGLTAEQDLAAQQLRSEHGRLAALIADPVTEAVCNAASVLASHLKRVVPLDQQPASAARLTALSGPETRYDADTRSRH